MKPEAIAVFDAAMRAARDARDGGALDVAFAHYERAHIVAQRHPWRHACAHVGMLAIGFARRDAREIVGQLFRIPAALTKSRLWVPRGNTGGANVSAFAPMPVPADLAPLLDD
jgi:hypothetical protein